MTKHAMTSADRTKIIEALKKNPNAAAVARQFGFGETTILALCKKEGKAMSARRTSIQTFATWSARNTAAWPAPAGLQDPFPGDPQRAWQRRANPVRIDLDMAPAFERSKLHEQIGGAVKRTREAGAHSILWKTTPYKVVFGSQDDQRLDDNRLPAGHRVGGSIIGMPAFAVRPIQW